MNKNRRRFIQTSLLGTAVAAAGRIPEVLAEDSRSKQKSSSLNILVLGGTGFIGPHIVREALRRGHEVTLFNRGKTNNTLFPDIELLVGDRYNGLDAQKTGNGTRWSIIRATCRDTSQILQGCCRHLFRTICLFPRSPRTRVLKNRITKTHH